MCMKKQRSVQLQVRASRDRCVKAQVDPYVYTFRVREQANVLLPINNVEFQSHIYSFVRVGRILKIGHSIWRSFFDEHY